VRSPVSFGENTIIFDMKKLLIIVPFLLACGLFSNTPSMPVPTPDVVATAHNTHPGNIYECDACHYQDVTWEEYYGDDWQVPNATIVIAGVDMEITDSAGVYVGTFEEGTLFAVYGDGYGERCRVYVVDDLWVDCNLVEFPISH
jgi:hypothetical protein